MYDQFNKTPIHKLIVASVQINLYFVPAAQLHL